MLCAPKKCSCKNIYLDVFYKTYMIALPYMRDIYTGQKFVNYPFNLIKSTIPEYYISM